MDPNMRPDDSGILYPVARLFRSPDLRGFTFRFVAPKNNGIFYLCLMSIVESNIEVIRELCSKHKVNSLFVFGSVLTDRFKDNSDIDFIVDFAGVDLLDYADNYFDFKFSLEHLFRRKVDLLESKAIDNPYLRQSIDSTKQLIYG